MLKDQKESSVFPVSHLLANVCNSNVTVTVSLQQLAYILM